VRGDTSAALCQPQPPEDGKAGPGPAARGWQRGRAGLVGPAQPLPPPQRPCRLQHRGTCLGPARLGPRLAGELARQAQLGRAGGALSPFGVPAGWCHPLSQAAVGGRGRQAAWCPGWCWRVHGPSLAGLTFTGLGPQGAVRVWDLPLQSRQGLGRGREGTRACPSLRLPVPSCDPPQLRPRAAPASHTLFE